MDDKFSSLKLKIYLFSSADSEQWRDQQKRPAKEKKEERLEVLQTHAADPTLVSHPCNYGYGR